MFNYSQKDVDNVKVNIYSEEESNKMLEFLAKDDFLGATESLKKGADPNFMKWNTLNCEIEHIFYHIFYNLWNQGSVNYISEIEEIPMEKDDNFTMFKNFFSLWKEKGGDINKKCIIKKPNDSSSYYEHYIFFNSMSDFINESLFISTKINKNKSTYFFYHTTDLLELLININNYFTPIKIEPVYQTKSLLGLLTREGWRHNHKAIINLLDETHPSFIIDEKGDTPLHYNLDINNQCNYYIKENISNYRSLDIIEYLDNYSSFINNYFNKETLIIKNKENLIPLEKMIKEKSYIQGIALASLMIKNNLHHNCFNEIDFSVFSLKNIKEYYHLSYKNIEEDKKLNNSLILIQSYIEKSVINKSLIKNNKDDLFMTKRL